MRFSCAGCHQKGKSVCKGQHIPVAVLGEIILSNLKQRLLTPDRGAGLRLRRGRPMPEREESDLLQAGNLLMQVAVCDPRCAGWWKAFTIRSNPLELRRRFRPL